MYIHIHTYMHAKVDKSEPLLRLWPIFLPQDTRINL